MRSMHSYAMDSAGLLDDCLMLLQQIILVQGEEDRRMNTTTWSGYPISLSSTALYDLQQALMATEESLLQYLHTLEQELVVSSRQPTALDRSSPSATRHKVAKTSLSPLRSLLHRLQRRLRESASGQATESSWQRFVEEPSSWLSPHASHQSLSPTSIRPEGPSRESPGCRSKATDLLLFRLVVSLQLCWMRLHDAFRLVTGRTHGLDRTGWPSTTPTASSCSSPLFMMDAQATITETSTSTWIGWLGALALMSYASPWSKRDGPPSTTVLTVSTRNSSGFWWFTPAGALPLVVITSVAVRWTLTAWRHFWMSFKLVNSTRDIEDWNEQWQIVQESHVHPSATTLPATASLSTHPGQTPPHPPVQGMPPVEDADMQGYAEASPSDDQRQLHGAEDDPILLAAQTQRLVSYALQTTPKATFWLSHGEIRFLMVKHAMDVFYASVGTAMEVAETPAPKHQSMPGDLDQGDVEDHPPHRPHSSTRAWPTAWTMAAAATFYSVTGARQRALEATSSSASARTLIQQAWGMVSFPAIKNLSLQASRLLKGAAVADRIEIAGVSCFVLSSEPAPELAAAIKCFHQKHRQVKKTVQTLTTIREHDENSSPRVEHRNAKNEIGHEDRYETGRPFARSTLSRFRQRDVILHLTGGGFFAHILATDIPYLLDWSAATGAIVICPEYGLLPEHTFPYALLQVEAVYQALASGEGTLMGSWGFEVRRIIVTGESAGGNLAAAMCVKIVMDALEIPTQLHHRPPVASIPMPSPQVQTQVAPPDDRRPVSMASSVRRKLPTALMLSCPVLDLSFKVTHSRVVGTDDPVLPSGLLSVIAQAYVRSERDEHPGYGDEEDWFNPLISPYYASDQVLQRFPPTLLLASATDPLLDDAIALDQRLRRNGVESHLQAVQHVPHAYLGLGTAGFPEAQQIQRSCQAWLRHQFTRIGPDDDENDESS